MFRSVLTVAVALAISATALAQDSKRLLREIEKIEQELKDLPAKAKAAQSKVEFEKDTVIITATDLDNAKDTLFEARIKHSAKQFKVIVAPPMVPTPKMSEVLKGKDTSPEVPLSLGKSLVKGYRESLDILADRYPDLAKRIKENPYDVRGNLDLAEQKLGLDKLREGTSLIERCYRVAWVEGLSRYGRCEDVSVTFLVRK